jgi:hypothetical protein
VAGSAGTIDLARLARGLLVAGRRGAARRILNRRLDEAPDDGDAIELLAGMARGDGDMAGAIALYRRLAMGEPGHLGAAHALSLLADGRVDAGVDPGHTSVAPFVLVRDFLAAHAHDRLLGIAAENLDEMVPAGTGYDGAVRTDQRVSFNLYNMDAQREVQELVVPRLLEALPAVTEALATPVSDVDPWECRYRAYRDGSFFAPHRDRLEQRVLTWVYWFHRVPQSFTGGDLLLYDRARDRRASEFLWTRFAPVDNALICFRSDVLHEVTTTHCDPADPMTGRFIVHGHVRGGPATSVYEPI